MRNLVLWLAIGGFLLGRSVSAQEIGEDLCGDCHSTGRIPHPHKQSDLDTEQDAIYCSYFMERDPEALGIDWVVCPRCRTPSAQARARREFEAEFGKRQRWLEERRAEVDRHAGKEILHIRTRHFLIAWDIPKVKVGRQILREHDALHLYARRMEDLFAEILSIHGIGQRSVHTGFYRLYLFESEKTARLVGNQLMGGFSGDAKSMVGPDSSHVRYWNKEKLPDDDHFHQVLVHSVSHLIHNDIDQFNQWMSVRYGWVYEGLAHFLEIRLCGHPITWCHQEAGGFEHWKGTNWEGNVRKAVLAGTHPPFQDVITKATDTLTPMEHQFAWSYIDYLMWLDPTKMPKLIGYMKGPQLPTRDALQKAYGLSIGEFVDGWEQFVRTEYSIKPVKGPRPRPPRRGA